MVIFRSGGKAPGALLLFLGVACVGAAMGLFSGRTWAWWFAVALFTVTGLGDAVSLVYTRDYLRSASGVVISGVFLFALNRDRVRQFCRR